jgi:hypothetical protein
MALIGSLSITTGLFKSYPNVLSILFCNLCGLQRCFQSRARQESKYYGLIISFSIQIRLTHSNIYCQVGVSFGKSLVFGAAVPFTKFCFNFFLKGETRELAFLHAKTGTKVHKQMVLSLLCCLNS